MRIVDNEVIITIKEYYGLLRDSEILLRVGGVDTWDWDGYGDSIWSKDFNYESMDDWELRTEKELGLSD